MTRWIVWAGRLISLAPVFICLSSARRKLTHNAWYVGEWTRIGRPALSPASASSRSSRR